MAITINGSTGISGVPAGGYNLVDGDMPSGAVLQVVSGTNASELSTTSQSWVDTGLQVTITPSSSSSKIFIAYSIQNVWLGNAGSGVSFRITRNGNGINTPSAFYALYCASSALHAPYSDTALDSPATTSAITYKVQVQDYNTNVVDVNDNGVFIDTITAMEIAG